MAATVESWCDERESCGFGRRGVEKIELMRCARMALLARRNAGESWRASTPFRRGCLTLREMFGSVAVNGLSRRQLAVGVTRLMAIDLATGGRVIGLANAEYRAWAPRLSSLRRRWEAMSA